MLERGKIPVCESEPQSVGDGEKLRLIGACLDAFAGPLLRQANGDGSSAALEEAKKAVIAWAGRSPENRGQGKENL